MFRTKSICLENETNDSIEFNLILIAYTLKPILEDDFKWRNQFLIAFYNVCQVKILLYKYFPRNRRGTSPRNRLVAAMTVMAYEMNFDSVDALVESSPSSARKMFLEFTTYFVHVVGKNAFVRKKEYFKKPWQLTRAKDYQFLSAMLLPTLAMEELLSCQGSAV